MWGYECVWDTIEPFRHDRKLLSEKPSRKVATCSLQSEYILSTAQLGKRILLNHCIVKGNCKAIPMAALCRPLRGCE